SENGDNEREELGCFFNLLRRQVAGEEFDTSSFVSGPYLERFLKARNSFEKFMLAQETHALPKVSVKVRRSKLSRFAQRTRGFLKSSRTHCAYAAPIVRIKIARLELE